MNTTVNPKNISKVLVLQGGISEEKEVSNSTAESCIEALKKIKLDIDRLADFWKECLDIGQRLVSFREIRRILDRYVERLVEFWKD